MIGLQPKLDAAGIWTEGYGHAMVLNGKFMDMKKYPTLISILPYTKVRTNKEAEDLLKEDVSTREVQVNNWLKVTLEQNQFDALLLHTFNCGKSDTLYRLINANTDNNTLKNWWINHYIKAGGKELKGLKLRRLDEWEIWERSDYLRNYTLIK
jgi:lysozyme